MSKFRRHPDEYSDDDDDEDEEEEPVQPLFKPVFIPKHARHSIREWEKLEEDNQKMEMISILSKEKLVKDSKKIVADVLKQEKHEELESAKLSAQELSVIDDTDVTPDEEAYQAWKVRELRRLTRDKAAREDSRREKEETERIRAMTDDQKETYLKERQAEIDIKKAEKTQIGFLQKYYHKGAFYQDEEDRIFRRNFNEPTMEDRVDRSLMPDVMQVKNFGKRSRTKWTHLSGEDTTAFDGAWYQKSDVNQLIMSKQAGLHGGFDKPTSKKKKSS